jgi:hypothetical protein
MQVSASAAADRRRHTRYPLYERARLRPNDWSIVQVGLRDISSHGFRAECDANIRIGGFIMLEIHGIGQVEAKIMWRRNDEIGAEFSRPISLHHCSWLSGDESPLTSEAADVDTEANLMELLARRASRRADELSSG